MGYREKCAAPPTIGNPLSDGTWSYTWEQGRQLASMSDGSTTWNYSYDSNGMRTGRSDGYKRYSYVYDGDRLTKMTLNDIEAYFFYDGLGRPVYAFTGINYIVVSIILNIQECGLDRSDFGLGIFMLGMALLTYMDLRPGMHTISVAICVISVQFFFNIGLAITCWSWWVIILCAVEVVASIIIVRIKFGPRKRRKKRQ